MADFAGLDLIAIPLIDWRGVPRLDSHVRLGRIGIMTASAGQPAGFGLPSPARGACRVAGLTVPNILRKRDVPVPPLHRVTICVRNGGEGIVQLRAEMYGVNSLGDGMTARPLGRTFSRLVVVASATLVDCGVVEYLVMT